MFFPIVDDGFGIAGEEVVVKGEDNNPDGRLLVVAGLLNPALRDIDSYDRKDVFSVCILLMVGHASYDMSE